MKEKLENPHRLINQIIVDSEMRPLKWFTIEERKEYNKTLFYYIVMLFVGTVAIWSTMASAANIIYTIALFLMLIIVFSIYKKSLFSPFDFIFPVYLDEIRIKELKDFDGAIYFIEAKIKYIGKSEWVRLEKEFKSNDEATKYIKDYSTVIEENVVEKFEIKAK